MNQIRLACLAVLGLCLCLCQGSLIAQTTELLSVDNYGNQANGNSGTVLGGDFASFSSDGRFVAFMSEASNLVPGDDILSDIFVRDRLARTTEKVSLNSDGNRTFCHSRDPEISADGRFVAFAGIACIGRSTNIYIHDRVSQTTEWVGLGSAPNISADGRYLIYSDYINHQGQLYDRLNQTIEPIFDVEYPASISADGRYIVSGYGRASVYDRVDSSFDVVDVNGYGDRANGSSMGRKISGDGQFVVYFSSATNLVPEDDNNEYDVFVFDRATETVELISIDLTGNSPNVFSGYPDISADGRYVVFLSLATNLVSQTVGEGWRVYVRDRLTQTTELRSVNSLGIEANRNVFNPSISPNGQIVAFWSWATNLVSADYNDKPDYFANDQKIIDDPQLLLSNLSEHVQRVNLQSGISNSLDSKLKSVTIALNDLNEKNDVAACNSLEAFINAVEAQSGKQISTEDALELVSSVEYILLLIECI